MGGAAGDDEQRPYIRNPALVGYVGAALVAARRLAAGWVSGLWRVGVPADMLSYRFLMYSSGRLLRRGAMRVRLSSAFVLLLAPMVCAGSPFAVKSADVRIENGKPVLAVSFSVPEHHHLYADEITVRLGDNTSLEPVNRPEPNQAQDPETKETRKVYDQDVTLAYPLPAVMESTIKVRIGFRGCSDSTCFLPDSTNIVVAIPSAALRSGAETQPHIPPATTSAVLVQAAGGDKDWKKATAGFHIVGTQVGFMSPDEFIGFLERAEKRETTFEDRLAAMFSRKGAWTFLALMLIVLGGLGLNLTPCVLPMIPINIAIIGAGSGETGNRSRARGFALGAVYGVAMAIVYGALGLAAVKTGTRFGTLNSSYIFNAIIAAVFLLLALAMFNVIHLDFSRFQGAVGASRLRGGHFVTAFFMGGVSALLAGSCVAPVVVSVLLISVDLCARHICIGLFLPFLLGLGMGLPWPFLGAGLSFLPRPGRWMEWVKYGFGVFIIGMAIYYGHLAYSIYAGHQPDSRAGTAAAQVESGWVQSLPAGLEAAMREKKPVLIDFWATWCKSCLAMNQATFKNERVKTRLARYIAVKQQAEDLESPATKEMLDHFKVVGLPTYVVLVPVER